MATPPKQMRYGGGMRSAGHIALQVIGWILDLIGLFGIPDDLIAAWSIVKKIQPYVESTIGRIILLVLGTGLLVFIYGRWLARRLSRRASISPAESGNVVAQKKGEPDPCPHPTSHYGSSIKGVATYGGSPDYTSWHRFEDLALFQAACLWAGVEPKKPVPSGEAAARLEMLQRAVWNGEIEADLDEFTQARMVLKKALSPKQIDREITTDDIHVSRSSLSKFAKKIDEEPIFLFPRKRK